jgi:uncharacterized protein YjiS (DUF1127 family)
VVAHDKAGGQFFGGSGRREAARGDCAQKIAGHSACSRTVPEVTDISPLPQYFERGEREVCVMFPLRILMRCLEWFEVHMIRWHHAYLELEDDTDEQLKDIGLEPLKRNFTTVKPFWKL